jgi:hypothetical protein
MEKVLHFYNLKKWYDLMIFIFYILALYNLKMLHFEMDLKMMVNDKHHVTRLNPSMILDLRL